MAKRYGSYASSRVGGPDSAKRVMLKEDKSKPSNLPQEVVMAQYPEVDYLNTPLDDTIYGIDNQMDNGVKGVRKQLRSRMF